MKWEELANIHNIFGGKDDFLFVKGETKVRDYVSILEQLGEFKWLEFRVERDRCEVEGFANKWEESQANDCDILLFDKDLRLVRFSPKELQQWKQQLEMIERNARTSLSPALQIRIWHFDTWNLMDKIELMRPSWHCRWLEGRTR